MIERHLSSKLRDAAQGYPAVTLTGPRQSGKTTLARAVFPDHKYLSLENPDTRDFALTDPRGFLRHCGNRAILDEVQRVPDLLSYIQVMVDEDDRPGRFVLTGSHNLLLMKGVSQSLAGRCAVLHLLPFSQSELREIAPMRPEDIGTLPSSGRQPEGDLCDTLFRGFYPRIHDKGLSPQDWLRNYYQTYVERDVRELINVGDAEAFGRFVRLCAGRSGQLLNVSSLGADCGISHTTAKRWLSVLETSFLIHLLRPHHRNFNKRLVKSPKLYFLDTGLLCYLLRIRTPEELRLHAARGAIFETYVVSELLKVFLHRGQEPDVHFWRDSTGFEVDAVLEEGEESVAIEAKSGETIAGDFFRGLERWRSLPGQERSRTALVYGGESSFERSATVVYSWADWCCA